MLEVDGFLYDAQCISCSNGVHLWARYEQENWRWVAVEDLVAQVISDLPRNGSPICYKKIQAEAVGRLGGVFCPECMPEIKNVKPIKIIDGRVAV